MHVVDVAKIEEKTIPAKINVKFRPMTVSNCQFVKLLKLWIRKNHHLGAHECVFAPPCIIYGNFQHLIMPFDCQTVPILTGFVSKTLIKNS